MKLATMTYFRKITSTDSLSVGSVETFICYSQLIDIQFYWTYSQLDVYTNRNKYAAMSYPLCS